MTSWIVFTLILLMLFLIVSSLALGLYSLLTDPGKTRRSVNALTFRIILSIFLFLTLCLAFALGWIEPHTLRLGS